MTTGMKCLNGLLKKETFNHGEKTMFNHADIIDTRDLIERIEDLEVECDGLEDECQELQTLSSIMDKLKGQGGDERWRGAWYPLTLIHENYFVEAMRELLEDIGDIPRELPSYIVIDWEATADNLRVDYSSVEIEGHTYWFR